MDLEEKIFSELDTKRFGVKVGKVTEEVLLIPNVMNKIRDLGFELLIARVELKNIQLINRMENDGFGLKDIQCTYYYNLEDYDKNNNSFKEDGYIIREFKSTDTEELIKVAKECFDGYGHYFSNDRLDKDDCIEVYGDWTYNSCTNIKVADKIFVSEFEGTPVGFLSFKIYTKGDKKYAAGGMGAVSPKHRGKSIFPRIVAKGLEWGVWANLDWEEHNVIVNNKSVNRSFTKMGFKPDNFVTTMHCWLD